MYLFFKAKLLNQFRNSLKTQGLEILLNLDETLHYYIQSAQQLISDLVDFRLGLLILSVRGCAREEEKRYEEAAFCPGLLAQPPGVGPRQHGTRWPSDPLSSSFLPHGLPQATQEPVHPSEGRTAIWQHPTCVTFTMLDPSAGDNHLIANGPTGDVYTTQSWRHTNGEICIMMVRLWHAGMLLMW